MSLVGPRPEMPFLAQEYNDWENQRHLVKPGITGLWQLSHNRCDAIRDGIHYDLKYIRNISFRNDLKILFRTLKYSPIKMHTKTEIQFTPALMKINYLTKFIMLIIGFQIASAHQNVNLPLHDDAYTFIKRFVAKGIISNKSLGNTLPVKRNNIALALSEIHHRAESV